jgi:DEAD/DEAH box helicase domain-containing protein
MRLISKCPCPYGCPSCVGPVKEVGERSKEVALALLKEILK